MYENILCLLHVTGFMPLILSAGLDSNNIVRLILQIIHDPAWNAASTVVGLISLRLAKRSQPKGKIKPPRSPRKSAHRHKLGRKKRSRLDMS
jgi:hypothetical protein